MNTGPESGVRVDRGAARWVLKGEITLRDVVDLRAIILSAVETQQAVLINCSEVTYFDTPALQFLASLRVEARTLEVSLQIEGIPGSVLADATPRGASPFELDHRLAG
jgi:anti-anti-sigma regulatory factor